MLYTVMKSLVLEYNALAKQVRTIPLNHTVRRDSIHGRMAQIVQALDIVGARYVKRADSEGWIYLELVEQPKALELSSEAIELAKALMIAMRQADEK